MTSKSLSFSRSLIIVLSVALLASVCSSQTVIQRAKTKAEGLSSSELDEVLMSRVFTDKCDAAKAPAFPKHIKWMVCVRIMPAFDAEAEFAFSVERYYDGAVRIYAERPLGDSLYIQFGKLQKAHPSAPIEELSKRITVESLSLDGQQWPLAAPLAEDLDKLSVSPMPRDTIYLDGTNYSIRLQSRTANAEFDLDGPGPDASSQPGPLLEWVEHARKSITEAWPQGSPKK
jgi:hypothetical protein